MNLRNAEQSQDREVARLMDNYNKIIDYISIERDWKTLCIAFAKKYPEEFNKVVNSDENVQKDVLISEEENKFIYEIHEALIDGKKIQAIKLVRQLTGSGLREAKTCIDDITARHGKTIYQHTVKTAIEQLRRQMLNPGEQPF